MLSGGPNLRLRVVAGSALLMVALGVPSAHTGRQSQASPTPQSSSSLPALLDAYVANPRPVATAAGDLGSLLHLLKSDAAKWAVANGAADAPRRRLAVATFVLEALRPQVDPDLWLDGAPATELLNWTSDFLKQNRSPATDAHGAERLWYIATVGLLEQIGGSSVLVSSAGQHYGRNAGEPSVASVLEYHVRRASARFPDEPRWALAAGVALELFTWPEWRDVVPFIVTPGLAASIDGAYERAAANPAIRVEALVRWGGFDLRRGLVSKALEHFTAAGSPADPVVAYWRHLLMGNAYHAAHARDDEVAAYRAALVDAPRSQSAAIALGAALVADHQDVESAAIVDEAITRPGRDPWPSYSFPDARFIPDALATLRRECRQ